MNQHLHLICTSRSSSRSLRSGFSHNPLNRYVSRGCHSVGCPVAGSSIQLWEQFPNTSAAAVEDLLNALAAEENQTFIGFCSKAKY